MKKLLVVLFVVSILGLGTYLYFRPKDTPSLVVPKILTKVPEEYKLDVKDCNVSEVAYVAHAFGHYQATVKEKKKNTCIFEYVDELEGGYVAYSCEVPFTETFIDITDVNKDKFCKKTKSGNLLMEMEITN